MALLNDERVGLTVLLITMAHYGMCMSVHYPGMGRVLPSQDCLSLVISGCAQNLCSLFQGRAGVLAKARGETRYAGGEQQRFIALFSGR
ncbi:unnamed protein product [Boreogadus saida]